MYLLTAAVAFSAWLIFSGHTKSPPKNGLDQVQALRDLVVHNFTVSQPISIEFGDHGFRFPDLVEAAQKQLDYRLASENVPYKYPLLDKLPKYVERPPSETEMALLQEIITTEDTDILTNLDSVSHTSIATETTYTKQLKTPDIPGYSVELSFQGRPSLSMDLVSLRAYMSYDLAFIHENDLPFYLTQAVYDMLLRPDLNMWHKLKKTPQFQFSDVIRKLTVNFVAAEESGITRDEITQAIVQHMRQFEAISSFVEIKPQLHVLDVSKRRAAPNLVHNTTSEITFFYSTTMRPYANKIQNVPLWHLDPEPRDSLQGGDQYGTEFQQRVRQSQMDTFDMTSFFEDVNASIKSAIHLPEGSSNLKLLAETAMKHYTILGLIETLDMLLTRDSVGKTYLKVAKLVDLILHEQNHDWSCHLSVVASLYEEVKSGKI